MSLLINYIKKRCTFFCCILSLIVITIPLCSFTQQIIEEQGIYTDSLGNVFVNKDAELYLFVADEENRQKKILLNKNESANPTRQGLHTITHTDPATKQQTHFDFFVDASPPNTEIYFPSGLVMRYENRYYCQEGAKIKFKAEDQNSGVNKTYYSINNGTYTRWDKTPISLTEDVYLEVSFYSVDNVGNIEKPSIVQVYFDIESVISLENIYFELNSSQLTSESRQQLNKLIATLNEFPELRIKLMSHTDSRGTAAYNLRLSRQRAESVKNFLVANGINPARLEAEGYGDTRLLNECEQGVDCPEEMHQANRRTEFKILPFK